MKQDAAFMTSALELAARGLGHTRPNPAVGAVVVKDGRIVGRGWHRKAGGDHAEVAAIKDARRHEWVTVGRAYRTGSQFLRGSTLYVTLEPCSKPGLVGACTDAIIAAGISRVVYALPDPNPKNRGKAKRALAKAGVKCERLRDAEVERAASSLVAPFAKHVATGLPYVTVKIAMSLDGKICDDRGHAKWISSAEARRFTGGMRERVDAIMVGGETIRRDNPSLLSHDNANPDLLRVVVSKSGKLPKNAQVFADGAPNRTLVFDDAKKALEELGRMGITHVLCEGGLKLARSLADQGFVDQWLAVVAPKVIGSRPVDAALCGEFFADAPRRLGGDAIMNVNFGG